MSLDKLCVVMPGTEEAKNLLDAEWSFMEITERTRELTQRFALRGHYLPVMITAGNFYTDEEVRLIHERASK